MSNRSNNTTASNKEYEVGSRKRPVELSSDDEEEPPLRAYVRVRKVVERTDERGTFLDLTHEDVELPARKRTKSAGSAVSDVSGARELSPRLNPQTEDILVNEVNLEQIITPNANDIAEMDVGRSVTYTPPTADVTEHAPVFVATRTSSGAEDTASVPDTGDEETTIDLPLLSTTQTTTTTVPASVIATSVATATSPPLYTKVLLIEPHLGVTVGVGIGTKRSYTQSYLGMCSYHGRRYWVYTYISNRNSKCRFGGRFTVVRLPVDQLNMQTLAAGGDDSTGSTEHTSCADCTIHTSGSNGSSSISDATGGSHGSTSSGDGFCDTCDTQANVGDEDGITSVVSDKGVVDDVRNISRGVIVVPDCVESATTEPAATTTTITDVTTTITTTTTTTARSDTDDTLPTEPIATTPTKSPSSSSAAAMDRILTDYKSLAKIDTKKLIKRGVDPAAFRALLHTQTKLAGAMRDMLSWEK